jgi:hypothetical protein
MQVGDKVIVDGEEATVVHVTPAIKEDCNHTWAEDEEGNPSHCTLCGLSFTRYIHCCMP